MPIIDDLIEKYLKRTIAKDERKQLRKLIMAKKTNLKLFKKALIENGEKQLYHEFDCDAAFEEFEHYVNSNANTKSSLKKYLPYAAAVVGLVSLTTYLMINTYDVGLPQQNTNVISEIDNNGVIHTLPDGSEELFVTNGTNGTTSEANRLVELNYQDVVKSAKTGIHSLFIPRGQKMKLTLPDGTRVWLNSGSLFSFPAQFNPTSERKVTLEGEAYFDVKENKSAPFVVTTNEMNIEVLGTEFNVSAYSDDAVISTTLVEGSVSLYQSGSEHEKVFLRPNQQGSFNKIDHNINTEDVEVGLFTAWMSNKIVFKDRPMGEILKQIERSYNVRIVNDYPAILFEKFTGEFDNESLETIFKALSTSLNFNYNITQHGIHIKK